MPVATAPPCSGVPVTAACCISAGGHAMNGTSAGVSPRAANVAAPGVVEEAWEEEVEDLLQWTSQLPLPMASPAHS